MSEIIKVGTQLQKIIDAAVLVETTARTEEDLILRGLIDQINAFLASNDVSLDQLLDWGYYATNIKYTNLDQTTPEGRVLTGEIGGEVVYRFISTSKTGLYPTEDSFYLTFDGTTLSELIATR